MNKAIVKKIVKDIKKLVEANNSIIDEDKILKLLHTYDKNFEIVEDYFILKDGYTTNITKKMLEETHAIIEYNPKVRKNINNLFIYVNDYDGKKSVDAYVNFYTEYRYSAYDEYLDLMLIEEKIN